MTPKSPVFLALAVLFLINILNFYDRNVSSALTEPIKHEFKLSDQEVGFLSTAFIWLYAIVGVPLGRLADSSSRKLILVGGVLVWTALTALNALAQNYTHLLLARLGVAVGEAVVAPTATSWIGDLVPPEKRARALAIFMLGVPIGGALSYSLSGPIAQAYGWRFAMVIAAIPAVLLAPALWFIKEPQRGAMDVGSHGESASQSMWSVLRIMHSSTDHMKDFALIDFPDAHIRLLGQIVGTADLVGQMADDTYLEKLQYLYSEFKEAHLGNYQDAQDLMRKTRNFYEVIRHKLDEELGSNYLKLAQHFKNCYGDERNYYLESIEKNIAYLTQAADRESAEDSMAMLRRRSSAAKASSAMPIPPHVM